MRTFFLLLLLSLLISCGTPSKKAMNITGTIDGLRKGTLYLQKFLDTTLVSIDSFTVQKDKPFSLGDDIDYPQIYYLYLDKEDGDTLNDRITFFGEKGDITINSLLKTFESSAQVSGSENHVLWEDYQAMLRRFNAKSLDLVKNYLEEDSLSLDVREAKFDKDSKNLLKRRYLFALNYATNNADKEIAAYIGLYEISNVNPKLLDTLYSKMSKNVKNSTYGVEFNKFLSSLKEDKKE
ncbi:MAG: hypothetical protein ACI87X_000711 [Candidatus Arcticimaribacter sp.]|jgi:hypothetical protein